MNWQRVEKFVEDFFSALGYCVAEDLEVLDIAVLAVVCLGAFWLLAVVVHEIMFDPHVTTAAVLDSLSIKPEEWSSR